MDRRNHAVTRLANSATLIGSSFRRLSGCGFNLDALARVLASLSSRRASSTPKKALPLSNTLKANVSLPEVVRVVPASDVISPLTPETHHLLNAERIARLPDDAVVVNTARGAVVDDDALIAALSSGKLFAAGLDVFNGEPDIDPRYRVLDNTFLLPHIGSATRETRDAMGFRALDNLDAIMAGSEPRDRLA